MFDKGDPTVFDPSESRKEGEMESILEMNPHPGGQRLLSVSVLDMNAKLYCIKSNAIQTAY